MHKNNLGLEFPEQTTDKPSIDLSLSAIEKWRSNLQTTDLIETAKSILKNLAIINGTVLHPNDRFELVECIRPLCQIIYQSFKQRYINQVVPLSQQKLNLIDLSKNLQIEMLNSYKIIIADIYNSFKKELKNSTLPNAIYRAFKHFNNLLLIYYQTYTYYPEKIWIEMHILYKLALECSITDNNITLDIDPQKSKTLTITPYKIALFVASINPYQWRQQEQESLIADLFSWNEYIVIRNSNSDDREQNDLYYIPIDQDLPPFETNNKKIEVVESNLILDLSKLASYLKNVIKQNNKLNHKEFKEKFPALTYSTLEKLLNYLVVGSKHKLESFSISGEVSVAFGFPSTHFYINKKREFKPELIGINQENDSQDLQLGLGIEEAIGGEDFKPDQALYQCKLISIHPERAVIALKINNFPPMQPEELVAMAINVKELADLNPTYWNIGILHWLKRNKELELHFGIEIIAPFAMAAAIQLTKENKTTGYFQRAFLFNGNNENKEFSIITPITQFETGKNVKIHSFYHNKSIETTLKEQLLLNNSFKLFRLGGINF